MGEPGWRSPQSHLCDLGSILVLALLCGLSLLLVLALRRRLSLDSPVFLPPQKPTLLNFDLIGTLTDEEPPSRYAVVKPLSHYPGHSLANLGMKEILQIPSIHPPNTREIICIASSISFVANACCTLSLVNGSLCRLGEF